MKVSHYNNIVFIIIIIIIIMHVIIIIINIIIIENVIIELFVLSISGPINVIGLYPHFLPSELRQNLTLPTSPPTFTGEDLKKATEYLIKYLTQVGPHGNKFNNNNNNFGALLC